MLDSEGAFYENQKRRKIENIWNEHSYFRKENIDPGPRPGPSNINIPHLEPEVNPEHQNSFDFEECSVVDKGIFFDFFF